MPNVRLTIDCNIPARGYCNKSVRGLSASKQLCKFCKSTKNGHYCILHEVYLVTEGPFVHQTNECWDAAISGKGSVTSELPQVDPKLIAREAVKEYVTVLKGLINQGYPQSLAETIAKKHVLGD